MNSEVTVLIPSYNPRGYLIDALDSLFKQTYPHWKAIVIDDASTDNSLQLAHSYLKDERVIVIQNVENIGQSKCMNKGLQIVQTPYIVQLDADDWFYPHTLEVLLEEANKVSEKVAVISGNICTFFENEHGHFTESYITKNQPFTDKYKFLQENVSVWPRFYRTSALRAVGGWPVDDPYEGRYMEDKRILMRLIEHFHFHWIDVELYCHRRHAQNQTLQLEKYQFITEWNVRDALKRWGDLYEPVFIMERNWLKVKQLIPK